MVLDSMIDTVHIIGMPPEETMQRLKQSGLELLFYPAMFAEVAAAEHAGPNQLLMLGMDPAPPGALSWTDVAPGTARQMATSQLPSTDQIMQAVVQYNWHSMSACGQHADTAAAAQVTTDTKPAAQPANGARAAPVAGTQPAGAAVGSSSSPSQLQPLVVGYVMKASREKALASAGLLHTLPQDGLSFMPIDPSALMPRSTTQQEVGTGQQQQQQQQQEQQQLPAGPELHIDILLHKASDELVALTESTGGDAGPAAGAAGDAAGGSGATAADPSALLSAVGVAWSSRLCALQQWLSYHPEVCVVDPFQHTAKVLDRLLLAQLLAQLQGLELPWGVRARGPAFHLAQRFNDNLAGAVEAAGLQPPFIVKPRVACGVAHSHSMALVWGTGGLSQLMAQLPTPALVQEYVNHGGQQHKVYVLGDQVFVTQRASIPDIDLCQPNQSQQQQEYLLFDSLASLPTQLPAHLTQQQQQQDSNAAAEGTAAQQQPNQALDAKVVQAIAAFLRQALGLTLFGFDVVVPQPAPGRGCSRGQPGSSGGAHGPQELVVIDVNYFPNYKGGVDTPAMFRAALRQAWQQHQQQRQARQDS